MLKKWMPVVQGKANDGRVVIVVVLFFDIGPKDYAKIDLKSTA